MKRTALLVTLLLGVPIGAAAQKPATMPPKLPAEARNTGTTPPPARRAPSISGQVFIEDLAPSFELDASDGRAYKLSSSRGYWTLLAFADRWQHLDALQEVESGMKDLGLHVVGVCHEKAHTLLGAAERGKLPVRLLADVTGEVSATYGLYDFVRSETEPGVLIIDPNGIVRLAILGRLPPADSIVRLARYMISGA
jgi:peroxiredoxin